MQHLSIHVIGTVQGVFFRASAKQVADKLSLAGFVRNEPDGSVYIEAEGDENQLKQLVAWCRQGPPRAQVLDVITKEAVVKNFKGFEVRR
jgi:acylphosphatase